jgi:hypothetical protein
MIKGLKLLGSIALLSFCGASVAESQDIMILPLYKAVDAKYRVEMKPTKVTMREGYDNQPKFGPEGKLLYFTRMLDKKEGEGQQTDIFRYDIESGESVNVTQTEDVSEYSATPYKPNFISVIGTNEKGQQHLRLVNLETKEHEILRSDIEPVGYHAWLEPTKAGVFVLGDVMTLQILDTESEQDPLALFEGIGRCLETVARSVVTFTQEKDGIHHMHALTSDGAISSLEMTLPQGVQDYVWLDPNRVIVGNGAKLFLVSSANTKELADLSSLDVDGITRVALSPDRTKLAVVYNRP